MMNPVKEVFAPHLGHNVKFGRRRSAAYGDHPKLASYVKGALPTPPPTVDYTKPAAASLVNLFGNDKYGDCVFAGYYHVDGVLTGNAGKIYIPTLAQVLGDYSAVTGFIASNPATDNGADMQTALAFYKAKGGTNGTKLLGSLAVDATNKTLVMQAIDIFENGYLGLELPDVWITPFPARSGFVWDVGTPDPDNGHCVAIVGYTSVGVTIATWGMLGTITWAALASLASAASGGELYAMLSPDQIGKGMVKAPNGLDWSAIVSDFDAIGGSVPVPAPAPSPSPSPVVSGLTLAQAQQAAAAGLAAAWPKS